MLYAEVGRRNEARELLEELQRQSKLRFVDPVYVTNLRAKPETYLLNDISQQAPQTRV